MKFNILSDILFELLTKRTLTASYLAEKHGVSVRTVYRYVDMLSLNVPIYVKRGRNGGICISDSYKLPVGFMTKEEYHSTIEALETMYSQLPEERFLLAKQKLSAQMKTEDRDFSLSGNIGTILVDGGTWGNTRKFSEKIRLLEDCIKEKIVVEIEYHSRKVEATRRKIEPHVLVFRQGVWYVFAFCRKQRAFRLFHLGRIATLFMTEEKFIRRPFQREDIPLNYRTELAPSVDVTLRISAKAFVEAQDWLGIENLKADGEDWIANLPLPDDEWLVKKIIGMGSDVKVIAPKSLQLKVLEEARRIMKNYE